MQAGIKAAVGSGRRRQTFFVMVFTGLVLINGWLWIDLVRSNKAPETAIAVAVGSVALVALYALWRNPISAATAQMSTPSLRFALATHQAGHIVATVLNGPDRIDNVHLYGPCAAGLTSAPALSHQSLQNQIASNLAGIAAEEIFTGESTSRASDDLARSTELGADMVGRFGMGGSLVSLATGRTRRPRFIEKVLEDPRTRKELEALLRDAKRESMRLMLENRHIIVAVRDELLRKERLSTTEIQLLFDQARSEREDADEVLVDLRTASDRNRPVVGLAGN